MKKIHLHPKYQKVYEAVVIKDIDRTIGNSAFKTGEKVMFCFALRQETLESLVCDKMLIWRKAVGGQWVMCDDIQDSVAENFEQDILSDITQYQVFMISEGRKDMVFDFDEAKEYLKSTGKWFRAVTPEKIVEDTIYLHNRRVW